MAVASHVELMYWGVAERSSGIREEQQAIMSWHRFVVTGCRKDQISEWRRESMGFCEVQCFQVAQAG